MPPFTVGPLAKAIYAAAHQCYVETIEPGDAGLHGVQTILNEHHAWTYRGVERQRDETQARVLRLLAYLDELAAVEDAPYPLTVTHDAVRRILAGNGDSRG